MGLLPAVEVVEVPPPLTHTVSLSPFTMENTDSLHYVPLSTGAPPGCEPCAAVKAGAITPGSVRSQVNPDCRR